MPLFVLQSRKCPIWGQVREKRNGLLSLLFMTTAGQLQALSGTCTSQQNATITSTSLGRLLKH